MKKPIVVVVALILAVFLVSCGANIPQEAKELGRSAVEAAEDYLAAKITAEEAKERLDMIHDRAAGVDKGGTDPVDNAKLSAALLDLRSSLSTAAITGGSDTEVRKRLDELKKRI